MSVEWPATLPLPQFGLRYNVTDPQMRTLMASGRTISRRRFSDTPTEFSARWILRQSEAEIFEQFYQNDAVDGSEWIEMPLVTPRGDSVHFVRFRGAYRYRRVGPGLWEYSANLQMYSRIENYYSDTAGGSGGGGGEGGGGGDVPPPWPAPVPPPLDITSTTYWGPATPTHLVWDGEKWSVTITATTGVAVGLSSTFALQQLLGQDLTTSPLIVEWEVRGWGPVDMYIFASSGRFATTYSSGHPQNTIIRSEFAQKNTNTTATFTIGRASGSPPEPAGRQVIIHKIYLEVDGME